MNMDALIGQARADDRAAQGELLRHYDSFLRTFVGRRLVGTPLQRRVDASDVVQEVNAKACKSFGFQGSSEAEFTAWIMTIAENTVKSLFREHGAQIRDLDRERSMCDASGSASVVWHEPAAQQSSPSQRLIRGEEALRLLTSLEQLPADQAEAVRLRHLDGLSTLEICEAMGRTPPAVAGLLQRALRRLRQLLADESDARQGPRA